MADVWANSMPCHPRATCYIAWCCHFANSMSWFQSYVSHCRVLLPVVFNGMLSQSRVSHCRVLPLGEFTVTIPEPHATLQGAVTWRNQCHDRATLQGVRISSANWKLFLPYFIKPQLTIARLRLHERWCPSVCPSVCRQNAKKRNFLKKLSNLELRCLLTTYRKSYMGFSK